MDEDQRWDYLLNCMAHCLMDCCATTQWAGKYNEVEDPGLDYETAKYLFEERVKNVVPQIHKAMREGELEKFFGAALKTLVEKEAVEVVDETLRLTFTAPFPQMDEEKGPEMEEQVVDGIKYPFVTAFSPTQVKHFAENEALLKAMYPSADIQQLRHGARHIREGLVDWYEHGNKFMYYLKGQ